MSALLRLSRRFVTPDSEGILSSAGTLKKQQGRSNSLIPARASFEHSALAGRKLADATQGDGALVSGVWAFRDDRCDVQLLNAGRVNQSAAG